MKKDGSASIPDGIGRAVKVEGGRMHAGIQDHDEDDRPAAAQRNSPARMGLPIGAMPRTMRRGGR